MSSKDEEKLSKVECSNCKKMVHAYRTKKGRVLITTTGGLALGVIGGAIGTGIGIATGGWASAATIPMGVAGAVLGSGVGYLLGDTADKPHCPNCEEKIDLGI